MKSLILLLNCIKISSSTSQDIIQYCNGGECEELLQYDELVISDICFNEKIIQFNNSRGLLYRGLTYDKKSGKLFDFVIRIKVSLVDVKLNHNPQFLIQKSLSTLIFFLKNLLMMLII